jgi:hypothetical protein
MKKKCYILGSSESLLRLSNEEIQFLNSHPNVLAMNKYLLFYKLIGVYPKDFFLIDTQFPGPKVLQESMKIAQGNDTKVRFFIGEGFRQIFQPSLQQLPSYLKSRLKYIIRNKFFVPFRMSYSPVQYFKFKKGNDFASLQWANTFDEELCFYRGSLTTAINLCYLIYPECDIYLLGVDLNTPNSFYQKEIQKSSDLVDSNSAIQTKTNRHATALQTNGFPGIEQYLPKIVDRLRGKGINLYCCSKESLLVKEGICEYRSVIE